MQHLARHNMPAAARRAVLLAAVLLVPWPSHFPLQLQHTNQNTAVSLSHRLVAGQGLLVGPESLGAGELAVAQTFDQFEDMLAVAGQLSGGRGRGGRGRSNNLGGGGFSSYTDMVQLQLSSYILATTPVKFRTKRLPKIRDQGSCSTCVAQAVAAATQMSIAAALNESVSKWDISARSLYYCSLQGRSCKTGWDIPDALKYILDQTPELVHPSSCLATSDALLKTESGFTGWRSLCAQALEKAAAGKCKGHLGSKITRAEPWMNCTYKSMSSFVEIQEHIRAHGSVVSRIIIYDDFQVQFNRSARLRSSEQLPPYQRNLTARPAFGHAVVLVGYDNENYTWTAMNSWGKKSSTLISQPGVTADGMFRIQMGIGGVGTPEHTYGITCTATEQRQLATVNIQPWEQERRAVQPGNDTTAAALNTLAECYRYTFVKGDTVASVVGWSGVSLRDFIQNNTGLFGGLQDVKFSFASKLDEADIREVLQSVQQVTSSLTDVKPSFTCLTYAASGAAANVTCDLGNTANCAGQGVAACTLHYKDVNVTDTVPIGSMVRLCDSKFTIPGEFDKVAFVGDKTLSQQRALVSILKSVAPTSDDEEISKHFNCRPRPFDRYADLQQAGYILTWYVKCTFNPYQVTELFFSFELTARPNAQLQAALPALTPSIMNSILLLKDSLESLRMDLYSGTLPAKLGALSKMRSLTVLSCCMAGSLPPNLLLGLPHIDQITIRPFYGAEQYQPFGSQCGITGPVPSEWFTTAKGATGSKLTPGRSLEAIDLSNNRLTGNLPDLRSWSRIWTLQFANNEFSGGIPAVWADNIKFAADFNTVNLIYVYTIDLANNRLSGVFPREWSKVRVEIELSLGGNSGLQGCVPLKAANSIVTFEDTGITGVCTANATEVEAQQVQAVQAHLVRLLGAGAGQSHISMLEELVGNVTGFGGVFKPGETQFTYVFTRFEKPSYRYAEVVMVVQLMQGATYITSIQGKGSGLGLNLTHLVPLTQRLPRLEVFECGGCDANAQPGLDDLQLPAQLPQAALVMRSLMLTRCGLRGSLPDAWGSWGSLEELRLGDRTDGYEEGISNSLTGSIPVSYANLARLKVLDLSLNKGLTGMLPPEFGSVGKMQIDADFNMGYTGLHGPIPLSWSHFSLGRVEVGGSSISVECIPDRLSADQYGDRINRPCSRNRPDVNALVALQTLINMAGGVSDALATWNSSDRGGTGPNKPPNFCRQWKGVSCDAAFQITALNLTMLDMKFPASRALPLSQVVDILQPLNTFLLSLNAASLQFVGTLPANFATFYNLQHLNLHGNRGLTGSLPSLWSALTALQTLDVSGTGISGSLPPSWTSLQELRAFRAADCSSLSGPLPLEWGILRSLEELVVTNSNMSGALPAWTDAAAMRAAADAALAAAQQAAGAEVNQAAAADVSPATVQQRRTPAARDRGGHAGPRATAAATSRAVGELSAALAAAHAGTRFMPLRVINLSGNKLSGQLVPGWSLFEQLQVLVLANNTLSGSLPESFARLTTLAVLDVSSNAFSGTLPASWVSLRKLQRLDLSSNALISPIPEAWSYLYVGAGSQLKCLALSGNAGLSTAELAALKSALEQRATGKITVVVSGDGPKCPSLQLL